MFSESFNFKTKYFEMPSERWETALRKTLAVFCHEYDNPEDLVIIYYCGHLHEGREARELHVAA